MDQQLDSIKRLAQEARRVLDQAVVRKTERDLIADALTLIERDVNRINRDRILRGDIDPPDETYCVAR